jgi:hypothetical protein
MPATKSSKLSEVDLEVAGVLFLEEDELVRLLLKISIFILVGGKQEALRLFCKGRSIESASPKMHSFQFTESPDSLVDYESNEPHLFDSGYFNVFQQESESLCYRRDPLFNQRRNVHKHGGVHAGLATNDPVENQATHKNQQNAESLPSWIQLARGLLQQMRDKELPTTNSASAGSANSRK